VTLCPKSRMVYRLVYLLQIFHADRFVDAIRAEITSEEVSALPNHLGSVGQFVDSTDALNDLARFRAVFE